MRKTEPHQKCSSSSAGEQRAERGDRAAERRPERDRLRSRRPRPERGDQGERGRVGHAGREAAEQPGDEEDLVGRRPGGEQAGGDRQRHAQEQHQLAAVAVAERAEVEHRGGQAERVADRDQVERRLRGVERLADVGQGDVGDRQVEVRDRGDQDQRDEDEAGALRGGRSNSYLAHGRSISIRVPLEPRPERMKRLNRRGRYTATYYTSGYSERSRSRLSPPRFLYIFV